MPELRNRIRLGTNLIEARHKESLEPPANWRKQAACVGLNPESFYPVNGRYKDKAIAVCLTCPVKQDCLTDAVEREDRHGVWGGMSAMQRLAQFPPSPAPKNYQRIDEVAVLRIMDGAFVGKPRAADRREATRRLEAQGEPYWLVAETVNISTRTVGRTRKERMSIVPALTAAG